MSPEERLCEIICMEGPGYGITNYASEETLKKFEDKEFRKALKAAKVALRKVEKIMDTRYGHIEA